MANERTVSLALLQTNLYDDITRIEVLVRMILDERVERTHNRETLIIRRPWSSGYLIEISQHLHALLNGEAGAFGHLC